LPRPAFDRTLTNRTTSGRDGSAPNGFSISNRIRSLPSQTATSASNGSFRRSSGRKLRAAQVFERQVCLQRRHSLIIGTQFSGEHAWPNRSVPSNVDASKEYNQSHTASVDANITSSTVAARLRGANDVGKQPSFLLVAPGSSASRGMTPDRRPPRTFWAFPSKLKTDCPASG
jgi:hypothetical protein